MTDFKNVKFGISQVNKIYLGENLVWNYEEPDLVAPTTVINPDPTLTYASGKQFWFEVDEACNTYYTLDGTTPTVNSTLYVEPFTLDVTTDVKYFSVDLAGNIESVKTTTLNIANTSVTTISPTNTTQSTIPFTVTLSATNSPTAIYYKLGATGTQQTYTTPFSVTQDSAGVNSAQIQVRYWSVNASGTEAEKSITYNTSTSQPTAPSPTIINGTNQVTLNWSPTLNTTSYSVYRSTVQGALGDLLLPSQYQKATTYTDTTAIGGTTYYYTVQSANYTWIENSIQLTGQPIVDDVTTVTTISPASTIQNTIPFTVTLSATNNPTAIYYRLGSGTQQTYTAPFPVNQNSAGVNSPLITIAYWSVNANGTETEKTITYDTKGAIPSKAVVSVINGENSVTLNWADSLNTTSYNIYRSTALGVQGELIFQYWWDNTYTDNTAIGGTTYYYTVISANFWNATPSDQFVANPTSAPSQPSYRYLKIQGYGATEAGQTTTTRLIEFQAWEGATNRMAGRPATAITWDTPNNTTIPAKTTICDGVFTTTANTYPYWWGATPNANIVIDLGASYALTKLNWYGYSINGVQRANRFNILASNTNNGVDWVNIWNMQNNTTLQPILPSGNYEKIL